MKKIIPKRRKNIIKFLHNLAADFSPFSNLNFIPYIATKKVGINISEVFGLRKRNR